MKAKMRQQGFSILEVMIAVLVLAIGLLGMAAMQAVALSSNQEAQFRIQALAIAEDLASRMRANREYINVTRHKYPGIPANHAGYNVYSDNVNWSYNANPPGTAFEPTNVLLGTPSANVANLNLRAQADVRDIRRQLKPTSGALLPAGSMMYVDCADKATEDYTGADTDAGDTCSPGSVYTIYVIWPKSADKTAEGQVQNANQLNARCATRIATATAAGDAVPAAASAGCVIMDIVP